VEGVESADVSFETKTVKVTCKPDVKPAALITALEGANFGGSVK